MLDYRVIEELELQMEKLNPEIEDYFRKTTEIQNAIGDYLWDNRTQRGYYDDQWSI